MGQQGTRWYHHVGMDQADHHQQTCEPPHLARSKMSPKPGAGFVKRCRGKLISSALRLDTILDGLRHDEILTTSNLDAINIYALQRDKQRVLMDLLLRKGHRAQEAFCKALVKSNPFLVQELDQRPPWEQVCNEPTEHLH